MPLKMYKIKHQEEAKILFYFNVKKDKQKLIIYEILISF